MAFVNCKYGQSKYLQPCEKKIIQFFSEKIKQVEADFNGKKSMRFRYTVMEEGTTPRSIWKSEKEPLKK
ncbi:MAG: hypothetical protein JO327_13740 [Nitrososphaeraceae archaeon]|nr:hypothetical protein [Nitrososphaeraceae archaeon]MBV9669176.1 hypothetical protein [Nitrososphaeraceae archaeon]